MPKSFKDKTSNIDRFFSDNDPGGNQPVAQPEQAPPIRAAAKGRRTKQEFWRVCWNIKLEHKEYLELASAQARKSITEYINDLIESDKANNKIWDVWKRQSAKNG